MRSHWNLSKMVCLGLPWSQAWNPQGKHTSEEREGGNISRKFREKQGKMYENEIIAIWPTVLTLLSIDTTSCCVLWSLQSPNAVATRAFMLKSCGMAGRTEAREGETGGNQGTKPDLRNVSITDTLLLWKGLKNYRSQPKNPTVVWGCYVLVFRPAQLLSCSRGAAADLPGLGQSSCSLLNAVHRLGCQLLWSHWRDRSAGKPPVPRGWNARPKVSPVVPAAAVSGWKPAVLLWVALQHCCPRCPLAWSWPAPGRAVCKFKGSLNPASQNGSGVLQNGSGVLSCLQWTTASDLQCSTALQGKGRRGARQCPQQGHRSCPVGVIKTQAVF